MALGPGTRLGSYEVLTLIGSRGMGEVYRANDTKLNRNVALKLLPGTFTSDSERLARFRREAQLLASLNHPHIAAIYGLDEANGTQFLVLELVDSESLEQRIARGRIPIDEALEIAKQIAEARPAGRRGQRWCVQSQYGRRVLPHHTPAPAANGNCRTRAAHCPRGVAMGGRSSIEMAIG